MVGVTAPHFTDGEDEDEKAEVDGPGKRDLKFRSIWYPKSLQAPLGKSTASSAPKFRSPRLSRGHLVLAKARRLCRAMLFSDRPRPEPHPGGGNGRPGAGQRAAASGCPGLRTVLPDRAQGSRTGRRAGQAGARTTQGSTLRRGRAHSCTKWFALDASDDEKHRLYLGGKVTKSVTNPTGRNMEDLGNRKFGGRETIQRPSQ